MLRLLIPCVLAAASIGLQSSCTSGPSSAPNYESTIAAKVDDHVTDFVGAGDCYATASLVSVDLALPDGDYVVFNVPLDVGRHNLDGGDTHLWFEVNGGKMTPSSGSIVVSHFDTHSGADGELTAIGSFGHIDGHWGCSVGS